MSYSLHKNGIITGNVNSFCLACESFFENGHDPEDHVEMSEHRRKLSVVPYSDTFEGHRIRKFQTGYYCEFCNLLLLSALDVDLHVADDNHIQNRGKNSLLSTRDGVEVFGEVVINNRAWHGLQTNVCCICDVEYDDEPGHQKNTTHILNLIQNPIKFGANDTIYRQIDNSTIHCLTCETLVSSLSMNEHFKDADHLSIYDDRKLKVSVADTREDIAVEERTDNDDSNQNTKNSHDDNDVSKNLASAKTFESNNIETETVFCGKCEVDIQFDHNVIEEHIKLHSQVGQVPSDNPYPSYVDKTMYSPKKDVDTSGVFDTNNEFKGNTGHNINKVSDCTKKDDDENYNTNTNVDNEECMDMKKNTKDGVENNNEFKGDKGRKENVETSVCSVQNPSLNKVNMKTFVHSGQPLGCALFFDCIVNEEFRIAQRSFYFIRIDGIPACGDTYYMQCLLCETKIAYSLLLKNYQYKVDFHVNYTEHKSIMEKIPVITSVKGEFIREIRPGSFHCGYCNLVVTSWVKMEEHLNTRDHAVRKGKQRHRYSIERYRSRNNKFF